MVYNIAVCDDEPEALRELGSIARRIVEETGTASAIRLFGNTGDLMSAVRDDAGAFHMILMDIVMQDGKTDGIEAAKQLRDLGSRASIVFISNSDQFMADGYDVRALKYILKPAQPEALKKVLLYDIENNFTPRYLVLEVGGELVSVCVEDIAYIESSLRRLIVHTTKGSLTLRGKLSELEEKIPANIFARCHNSFIVNLDYVERLGRGGIVLRTGGEAPVSKAYYNAFKEKLLAFLTRNP